MQELIVMAIIPLFIIIPLAFWIWALVDILKSDFTGSNKIIWLLVVIFLPLLGIILYFVIGRKQN
ncbi:MAG TPA: hypothetical protein DEP99_03500 [Nitrospiraceae bacterium]|nr:hypothetical protein [Nitrospiraceae bacterium]